MASPTAVPGRKKILIVDDDEATHDLLRRMLASPNREIESAFDGEEGLSKVLAGSYDLVLADILMPSIDGLELLRKIREARPAMMVVVITAQSTPERIVSSIREQAAGYISKPFTREAISGLVDTALAPSLAPDDVQVVSARPGWISLRLRCKLELADRLAQFFRELAADIDPDERDAVACAFRELLTNAIEHGGRLDPEQWVSITYVRSARSIIYYIRDPGEGFSLENLPHAAVSNRPEAPLEHSEIRAKLGIRPGGFGILMTRNFVDEVLYSQKGNEVMLIKYLS